MKRWWRAYDEARNDPKLQRLPGELFKTWFNICCVASSNDGKLPPLADLAFELRITEKAAAAVVASLKAAVLLDQAEDGTLSPHNWKGRQFLSDNVTERVQKHREKRRGNVPRNVSRSGRGNVPEALHGTTPENRVQSSEAKASAFSRPEADPERELFERGKAVLGPDAGGLIAKVLKAKEGKIPLARAVIETASTKQNPREYVGAVLRGAAEHEHGFTRVAI